MCSWLKSSWLGKVLNSYNLYALCEHSIDELKKKRTNKIEENKLNHNRMGTKQTVVAHTFGHLCS